MQQRRTPMTLVATLLAALVLAPLTAATAATAAGDPPNLAPNGLRHCAPSGPVTASCLRGALRDYDRARAREGLARISLPRNFSRLSVPGQLMVLANLDRVDRGLTPVAGLSSALQTFAQAGAAHAADPAFPAWTRQGGSNWASPASALWAEFLWMYDDGPGAGNLDCVRAGAPGCYGHRHNILAGYRAPLLMGAGVDARNGVTQLFLGQDRHDRADVLTWASERRLIPVGVSTRRLKRAGALTVWASGLAMRVRAKASGGWHVSRRGCRLRAGHACTLRVTGTGHGVLRLTGPNGTVTVALGRR